MQSFSAVLKNHQSDPTVVLSGDWHGNADWVKESLPRVARSGSSLILQLGDAGIWPGIKGERFLSAISTKADRLKIDIFITPGNHEDWHMLSTAWEKPANQDGRGEPLPMLLAPRIWVLPKGFSFTLNNVSFLSMGGAASVDYYRRKRDKDWWPQEAISASDVARAKALGEHDVLLTHEAPDFEYCAPLVKKILEENPNSYSEEGLAYSRVSRSRITEVFETAKPKLAYHGHFHQLDESIVQLPKAAHPTKVTSVSQEYTLGNLFSLRLRDLSHEILP